MDTTALNNQPVQQQANDESEGFNLSKIIYVLTLYWPWFILSVVVCLIVAFVYLRFKTPVYEITGSVLIQDNDKKGTKQHHKRKEKSNGLFLCQELGNV